MVTIVSDITRVIQIAVQHVITAGYVQYAAIGQHHIVRVDLTQTQRQLGTVIDGDRIRIQRGRLFGQSCTAIAVQIEAVGRYAAAVANIQR